MSGIIDSASFTRPSNTTAYASGDLVANSTSAGSVAPLQFKAGAIPSAFAAAITRARLETSNNNITNGDFRLHLFSGEPDPGVGDNAAFNSSGTLDVASVSGYLGYIDISLAVKGDAGAVGIGVPNTGDMILPDPRAGMLFGLLEARGAYTPASGEVFTAILELVT